ncbi:hypothetical protein EV363DRAFT_745933 [Boletus edulis]|nr:hypothetical protein EV363DRAFT_745933 [Boletus edulis]
MTQVKAAFGTPASRLQLLTLLDCFTSDPEFELHAAIFARHPLMNSLLNSLLLDNSPTTCTIGLTMLVKLLPIFAVKACEELKIFLPRLFLILARTICWEVLSSSDLPSTTLVDDDTHFGAGKQAEEYGRLPALEPRPELGWERLELRLTTSSSPPSDAYFSSLYYLFPCNLFRFLSGPAAYLGDSLESPYTVNWQDALDEDDIRCKAEPLLRSRVVNPRLIWRDWLKELTEPDLWASYSISQIASECVMLNIRNIALGSRSSSIETDATLDLPRVVFPSMVMTPEDNSGVPTPHPGHISLPPVKARVSLQDMVTTSVTLKSNLDIDVEYLGIPWSALVVPTW